MGKCEWRRKTGGAEGKRLEERETFIGKGQGKGR